MVVGERNSNTTPSTTIENASTSRPLNRRTKAQRAKDAQEAGRSSKSVSKLQSLFGGEKSRGEKAADGKGSVKSQGFWAARTARVANEAPSETRGETVTDGVIKAVADEVVADEAVVAVSKTLSQTACEEQGREVAKMPYQDDLGSSAPKPYVQASIFSEVPSKAGEAELLGLGRLEPYLALWPSVLGLAFCRIGLLCGTYGNYASSDEGIFTDGSMFVSLVVFIALFIGLSAWRKTIAKPVVNMLTRVCILVQFLAILGLTFLQTQPPTSDFWRFTLSVICTFSACGSMFYWLRRMRGCASVTAAVFVFSALGLSEILVYLGTLVPTEVEYSIAALVVLLQFPCQVLARRREKACSIDSLTPETDYFGFSANMITNRNFLIANAIGIACMGAVTGFLRGYPDGLPIPFTPVTRAAYGLLVIALCVAVVALVVHRRKNIMTVGFFLLLEVMACLALIMFSAFPGALDIGSVFATTLNALMVGFVWYITIAFMSSGWRDPYYYALAGWCVWLGSRSLARMALMASFPLADNPLLLCAVMGSLIVLSTQVVFVQFIRIGHMVTRQEAEREWNLVQQMSQQVAVEVPLTPTCPVASGGACVASSDPNVTAEEFGDSEGPKDTLLTRIMGLDDGGVSIAMAEAQQKSLEQSAREIGNQFMLSDREIEVLALYARGFTQKRVAEELYISPGTAHAHIKRIYAKTGFHSRQEILDYMEDYAS